MKYEFQCLMFEKDKKGGGEWLSVGSAESA